jgi:acetylornithine deacetylase/succinyl-diaminopimelate desuccinylase-like protein
VCRLNHELELGLPLQLISFLEEESSGFGEPLLGSRIMTQHVSEEHLREGVRAIDDGRPFWEHAKEAGYEPERWRESIHVLDDLVGWIEMHIEQGRVLQDNEERLGVVTAIVGLLWADIKVFGRADHAGGTPMDLRQDAGAVAAECVLELERLARAAGPGTVGTAGECEYRPGLEIGGFAQAMAVRRGMRAEYVERSDTPSTKMDTSVVEALTQAAEESGEAFRLMPSGAGHDTQLVASLVPSAMVFVPCKDGISHDPSEEARPEDGALAADVIVNAIRKLVPASLAGG